MALGCWDKVTVSVFDGLVTVGGHALGVKAGMETSMDAIGCD